MALAVYIIVAASVVCTLLGWMNVLRLFLGLLVLGWMMNITGCGTWMDFSKAKERAVYHKEQNDEWVELAVSPSRKLDTIDALVAHSYDRPFTPKYLFCQMIQKIGYDEDTEKMSAESWTEFLGEHRLNFTAVAEYPVTLDKVTWKTFPKREIPARKYQDIQMKRMSFKVLSDRGLDTYHATFSCHVGESWTDAALSHWVDESGNVREHAFWRWTSYHSKQYSAASSFVYIP